ncbi:MAG: response regulator transcription factor [Pegethrix bostrychoides GSE-TBD4-15B]|jgi:DNA-binding response OmpR family regulator|uniref:Response regulator transcription factor n=1 Tax=Pegethrix bostrychoides GSE-TBD4-15B TaxID=2839662 RepID=A0A951U400_9CYAN|nr:response regulator transcription factor [Pegethrix bostrychoides GSE-TBD4-15B]
MTHILIVEDEPRIVTFLEKGLHSNGFVTTTVLDGAAAVPMALEGSFDLMILDLGLPDKDGLTVLEEIRGQGAQLPVLILTARDDIQDKVTGFETGADDYLTKPFRFEELLVRIRARLRPTVSKTAQTADLTLRHGNITLDLRTHKVKLADRPVELSAREFTMLEVFLRHPGQVVSREQLLNSVWGYDYDPGSNVVDVYVGYLRKKVGSEAIETVRGLGYRWKA